MAKKKVKKAKSAKKRLPSAKHIVDVRSAASAKKKCKACEVSEPLGCPLCSGEGLVLIAVAIILIALGYTWSRYLAWAVLLLAFFVPMIKRHFQK